MFRSGKVLVVLGLLAVQVALAWPESKRVEEFQFGDKDQYEIRKVDDLVEELLARSQSASLSIVGKSTAQSSTSLQYTSDKAADGNKETHLYPNFMCTHTTDQRNPWWRVDLGGVHCIQSVTILNRGDCCSDRLTGAVVRVGTSAIVHDNGACGSPVTSNQAQTLGGTIKKICSPPRAGRYVGVEIPSEAAIVLQLCEVTVERSQNCPQPVLLSIVGKSTQQSTTYIPFWPELAADGDTSTILYPDGKCTHTEENKPNPWWRVDLGDQHCIESVSILNRGDCCNERLANAVIRVGTSTKVTDNKACGLPVTSEEARVPGGTVARGCPNTHPSRYVSVDIPSETAFALQLCEVTVVKLPMEQCLA